MLVTAWLTFPKDILRKLTWQWKITIFSRRYILHHGWNFPASPVSFQGGICFFLEPNGVTTLFDPLAAVSRCSEPCDHWMSLER